MGGGQRSYVRAIHHRFRSSINKAFVHRSTNALGLPSPHTCVETTTSQQLCTARTKPQLATGPQKCVVLGPVGELMNAAMRDPSDDMVVANTTMLPLLLPVGWE